MTTGERMKSQKKEIGRSAEEIAKALCTTPAYLMGWDEKADTQDSDNNAELCYVQYVGLVAAHFNATPTEEHEFRRLPREWLSRRRPEDFFVATVYGDSMYPQFLNGDDILCLRCSDIGHSGRIGIIVFGNDEATLKRIDYQPGKNRINVVPVNPEYQTKRIEGANLEQCWVVGRVVKVIRTVAEA